jgi:predicted DNA-binding protein YlxM (UPF0122 family)
MWLHRVCGRVYILTSTSITAVLQVLPFLPPFQMVDSRYLRLTIKFFINSIQKIGDRFIMPYKCEKMKIPPGLDRRKHITPEQSETMRQMYADGFSMRAIAREFKVHHRTVKLHISPEYAAAEAERRKREKPWLKYYDKECQREYIKNHRHYKRELELAGKLAE